MKNIPTKTYQARVWTYLTDHTLDCDELAEACAWVNLFPDRTVSATYGFISKLDEDTDRHVIIARFDRDEGLRPLSNGFASKDVAARSTRATVRRVNRKQAVAKALTPKQG